MSANCSTLRVMPLNAELRKSSQIGAEVILPRRMKILDLQCLSSTENNSLRRGLYDHNVLVIRDQIGISPTILPQLGKVSDETAQDMHSGGADEVKDPRSILAAGRPARIPRAPQASIIGQGKFVSYEGLEKVQLKHVVSATWRLNTRILLTQERTIEG